MIKAFYGIILASFFSASLLSACGGSQNTNSRSVANRTPAANSNSAKSNVEELGMMVRVPYKTEDIVWKQDPSTRHIVAVFRFSTKDADELVAEAEKSGPAHPASLPVESWFPEELIAQGEVSGDSTLKATAYPATAFFQEPYTTGRISRVDGVDYFILELSPK